MKKIINNPAFGFLRLQIMGAIAAVLIFKYVPIKYVAALMAGSSFTLIGIAIFYKVLKNRASFSSALYVASGLYLFVFSLPMLLIRAVNYEVTNFKELSVLGLNMGTYHHLSEGFYLLFVAVTIFELYRSNKQSA